MDNPSVHNTGAAGLSPLPGGPFLLHAASLAAAAAGAAALREEHALAIFVDAEGRSVKGDKFNRFLAELHARVRGAVPVWGSAPRGGSCKPQKQGGSSQAGHSGIR